MNRELIAEVLEILSIVEDLVVLQRAIGFSTRAERTNAKNTIRLLRLARTNIMRFSITNEKPGGQQ